MIQSNRATTFLARVTSGSIDKSTAIGVSAALVLGIFILMGVGIVGANVLHNAAHDTRHAVSFPCH